MAQVVQWYIR